MIYSPQATAWSERAVWGSTRRVMPYGNLAKTLVANGYDFDIVNDDLLQNRARFQDGRLEINGQSYRMLVLPRATVVPIETMRAIRNFAQAGGTVVALDEMPKAAAGLKDAEKNDRELKEITDYLFSTDPANRHSGVFLPDYKLDRKPFSPERQPVAPTSPLNPTQQQLLAVLGKLTPPDFAPLDGTQSDGLTFIHKQVDAVDVYFVTNLQPKRVATEVSFRVSGKIPQRWNAITGAMQDITGYRLLADSTVLAIELEAWESAFFVFQPGSPSKESPQLVELGKPLPEPLQVIGSWKIKLEGHGFETFETTCDSLTSWTDLPRTRHFSGTGRYEISFDVPADKLAEKSPVWLDLGQVGNLAEVELNGQPMGVAWMEPHRLDVTQALRAGKNQLVVCVSNALINYVSGLKQPTEVPLELQARLGKANREAYPEGDAARQEMAETDLPVSGLLGPVRLVWQ